MKKLLLASAVAALSVTAAHAAPELYGRAFLTVDSIKTDKTGTEADGTKVPVVSSLSTNLTSAGSRIGIKGKEDISDDLTAKYQLEYGVGIDNGLGNPKENAVFRPRWMALGVESKTLGSLSAGRQYSIDGGVDYVTVTRGAGAGAGGLATLSYDGDPTNDSLIYETPSLNGLVFSGMYVMDGGNDYLKRDGFAVAARYEPSEVPVKVGSSYVKYRDFNAVRVSGNYKFADMLTVGALYQNTHFAKGMDRENTFAASAELTNGDWTAYGQAEMVKNLAGGKKEKKRGVIGGAYAFNKNVSAHLYGGLTKETEVLATGATTANSQMGVGTGLRYNF